MLFLILVHVKMGNGTDFSFVKMGMGTHFSFLITYFSFLITYFSFLHMPDSWILSISAERRMTCPVCAVVCPRSHFRGHMESEHTDIFNSRPMQRALAQVGLTRDSQLQAASTTMSSGDGDDQHGKAFYFLLCYFSFWFLPFLCIHIFHDCWIVLFSSFVAALQHW